jgi:hypothetical protein
MGETLQEAKKIEVILNAATERQHNVIELRSWPLSMGAALDCGQTYLTRPIDRSDNYRI